MRTALILILILGATCHAQDVLTLKNGSSRSGEIVTADETTLRLKVPLTSTIPSQKVQPSAIVTIQLADIETIDFQAEKDLKDFLQSATPDQLKELEAHWSKFSRWLHFPRSPSGKIGCRLGELLIDSKKKSNAIRAVEIFERVEAEAWDTQDRTRARTGRIRASMVAGNLKAAIQEAGQIASQTENPSLMLESKLLMAEAAEKKFQAFLKENPRWKDDVLVIPERHRLYDEALALYLFPSLFYGSHCEQAAQGLWGAISVYQLSNESRLAVETARDLISFYPETRFAANARDFLAKAPPDQLTDNIETKSPSEQSPSAQESIPEKPKKKKTSKKNS
jgi:hypothetical protein